MFRRGSRDKERSGSGAGSEGEAKMPPTGLLPSRTAFDTSLLTEQEKTEEEYEDISASSVGTVAPAKERGWFMRNLAALWEKKETPSPKVIGEADSLGLPPEHKKDLASAHPEIVDIRGMLERYALIDEQMDPATEPPKLKVPYPELAEFCLANVPHFRLERFYAMFRNTGGETAQMPNPFGTGVEEVDFEEPEGDITPEMIRESLLHGLLSGAFEKAQADWEAKATKAESDYGESDFSPEWKQSDLDIEDLEEGTADGEASLSLRRFHSVMRHMKDERAKWGPEKDVFHEAMIQKIVDYRNALVKNMDLEKAYYSTVQPHMRGVKLGSGTGTPSDSTQDWEGVIDPEILDMSEGTPEVSHKEMESILSRNPAIAVGILQEEIEHLNGVVEKGKALVEARDEELGIPALKQKLEELKREIQEMERRIEELKGMEGVEDAELSGVSPDSLDWVSNQQEKEQLAGKMDNISELRKLRTDALPNARMDKDDLEERLHDLCDHKKRNAVNALVSQIAKLSLAVSGFTPQRTIILENPDPTTGSYSRVNTWLDEYRYDHKTAAVDEIVAKASDWRRTHNYQKDEDPITAQTRKALQELMRKAQEEKSRLETEKKELFNGPKIREH
ncbi:hypothetical protein FUAX_50000 (plasmid) [Fulvitalea axinellae]|uniref:Uncharacterized protein n=1 Tax=Fulvitalea axinellae TaxID=1182444 RepID=A0AAU9CQV7_9BACT|nr:hypothetical protein FUAX_50000 [Fulvitalea axinellae]